METPWQTVIIIRDGHQVTVNEYHCPDCGRETTIKKSRLAGSKIIDRQLIRVPLGGKVPPFENPPDDTTCKFCGSTDVELVKTNAVMASCCDKKLLDDNIYLCKKCHRRYHKKLLAGQDGMAIVKKIMADIPATVKTHFESEVK